MASLPSGIDPHSFDPRFRAAFPPRQRVWNALRTAHGHVSASAILCSTGVGLGQTARLLFGWWRQGHLNKRPNAMEFSMTQAARSRTTPPPITVIKRAGVPRRSGRQRLWSAMRVLKTFDLPTLCMAAETSEQNARGFLRSLRSAGYACIAGETGSGRTLYRLLRDTGPLHPVVRRRVKGSASLVEVADRNGHARPNAGKRGFDVGGED